jgi:hypothetical protein
MVVAKRGVGANFVQGGTLMDHRMKRLLNDMTWAMLKESKKFIPPGIIAADHIW